MGSDYRRHVGRQVLVQLDDHEIVGKLIRQSGTALTLAAAAVLTGEKTSDMDGEVVIDRLRMLWVQVV